MSRAGDPVGAVVRFLIAVLCGAAARLIIIIVSGSSLDETGAKAIGTAVAIAFFSLTGVAGTNLADRRPGLSAFGYLTAAISALALLTMLVTIWSDGFGDHWRAAVYTGILAFATGHCSVLLAVAAESDSDAVRTVRIGTIAALALLVVLTYVEVASPGPDLNPRLIAVLAVLYALGTIVLGLLRRSAPLAPAPTPAGAAAGADDGGPSRPPPRRPVATVPDWERSSTFCRDVLGAEVQPGEAILRFTWSGSAESAVEHLRRHQVEILGAATAEARGSSQSIYFRDPAGALIELVANPG